MMGLDGGRLNIGACSLGGAQRCLDEAVTYTKERKQFGQAIADFQDTQFTLADMETELAGGARAALRRRGQGHRQRARQDQFAAMAKRLATDTGSSVVDRALQLHGGYGYLHGLSDRALLARPAGPFDPRGDQPGDADDRRPRADCANEHDAHRPSSPGADGRSRSRGRISRLNQPAKALHALDRAHVSQAMTRGAARTGATTIRRSRPC